MKKPTGKKGRPEVNTAAEQAVEKASDKEGKKEKRQTAVFKRTKICKFHLAGACARGKECNFAHSARELEELPDLACTKFCTTLTKTGTCLDPQCRYAHTAEELRPVPPSPTDKKTSSAAASLVSSESILRDHLKDPMKVPLGDSPFGDEPSPRNLSHFFNKHSIHGFDLPATSDFCYDSPISMFGGSNTDLTLLDETFDATVDENYDGVHEWFNLPRDGMMMPYLDFHAWQHMNAMGFYGGNDDLSMAYLAESTPGAKVTEPQQSAEKLILGEPLRIAVPSMLVE